MHIRVINSSQTKNTLIFSAISAIVCGLIQSDWFFWIPGAVFGILFATANFHRKLQIGLFAAISSIIYIGAVRIFFIASGKHLNYYLVGGFFAGTFGALTLALSIKLLSKTPLDISNEFLSTIVGGITGIVFVQIFIYGLGKPFSSEDDWKWVLIPVAFAFWQIPVGWLLTRSVQSNSSLSNGLSANESG